MSLTLRLSGQQRRRIDNTSTVLAGPLEPLVRPHFSRDWNPHQYHVLLP